MNFPSSNVAVQILKIVLGLAVSLWLTIFVLGFASPTAENSEFLIADFNEMLSTFKSLLDQLSLEVAIHKQWFKSYQSQALVINGGVLGDSLNQQLNEIWREVERLEPLTKTGWLDSLSSQLDSYITAEVPTDEISNWVNSQKLYVEKIQEDVVALGRSIEGVQQTYPITYDYVTETSSLAIENPLPASQESLSAIKPVEETVEGLEYNYDPEEAKEYDALETSLLYLLEGLSIWGEWLNPANEIGFLPEAEGRFMLPSTPILQAGSVPIPGGIGVVGFAQPIIVSYNGVPQGFTEEISKPLQIDYDDSIEDVFQKVPHYDRLIYQYGVQMAGRTVKIYRRPIETELTLATALHRMGAPPNVIEVWVEEYAEIARLPQTIQLSWLIAGNPLAKDYRLYTENLLEAFDLNTFLIPNNQNELTLPQVPSPEWVNEDPFWEELQNQPFLRAFADLLNGASEEIQRSFIVSLFFVEPNPPVIQATSKSNIRKGIRSKPFFWTDEETNSNSNTSTIPTLTIDAEQEFLVAKALQQGSNLIHYWTPVEGDKFIPWSDRNLLDSNGNTPYFIVAVTALPQLEPTASRHYSSNYPLIVKEIINNYLPKHQPIFKVFSGTDFNERRIVNAKGARVAFSANFVWSTETLELDTLMQYATNYYKSRKFPYAAVKFDNGPYLAGSLHQLRKLLQDMQNYTLRVVVLSSKGVSNYKGKNLSQQNTTQLRSNETWLQYAARVSTEVFSWLPQNQNELLIKSTHRSAIFKRNSNLTPEVDVSSMVQWPTFPANATLLAEHSQWQGHTFLIQVEDGYFFVTTEEFEYLQEYASKTPKVHSLILSARGESSIAYSLRPILSSHNLNCDSLRVLSAGGVDLAYDMECSVVITDSGRELAQADAQTLLNKAQKDNQPIVIFSPKDKPASALPLRFLVDSNPEDIEDLTVDTLVPVYGLEELDTEEKENAIEIGVTDAIGRIVQFFPEQKTFEILLPEGKGQKVNYTSEIPTNFKASHSYDEVNALVPGDNEQATFYRASESVAAPVINLEVSEDDIYIQPPNEFNIDRILELAQRFHEKNNLHYIVVKSDQGKYYAGSLDNLNTKLPTEESPEKLLLMVTKAGGTNNRGLPKNSAKSTSWLKTSSEKVVEYAAALNTKPNDAINVWSSTGQRYAVFTSEGKLQVEPMIQWTERPDNQFLKSLRRTWNGSMILVSVPNKGYFVTQSNGGEFLKSIPDLQIDTILLSFDKTKNFSKILDEVQNTVKTLQITYPVRALSNVGLSIEENPAIYSGLDLTFKSNTQGKVKVDLELSGLELAEQTPEQWLTYTETVGVPLAIFEWPDGKKRSSALFVHVPEAIRDMAELTFPQIQIVPVYHLKEIASALDSEERENMIALNLLETFQRALTFLPNQTSFQVVMPDKTIRHYSQNPPSENQIQSGLLGVIEVPRQTDDTKINYYYYPNNEGNTNLDVDQTLAMLVKETGFTNALYQGTRPPNLEELVVRSNLFLKQSIADATKLYTVVKVGNEAYFGGPWHKIRKLVNADTTEVITVAVYHQGTFLVGKYAHEQAERNWLLDIAGQAAKHIFSTLPKNPPITVCARFCRRQVVFNTQNGQEIIDLAAMPQTTLALEEEQTETLTQWWDHLPSNATLLAERAKWQPDMVLMFAPTLNRYFWITYNEIPYFEEHTDQPVQVHTLVLGYKSQLRFADLKARFQRVVNKLSKDVSTIRVLSAPNTEIYLNRECQINIWGSCGELLQRKPKEWLPAVLEWGETLVVFENEGNFSGIFFRMLLSADLSSIYAEGITPDSVVPAYSAETLEKPDVALNDPDARENIAFSITETLKQVYPLFPKQQEIKIVMPNGNFAKYTLQKNVDTKENDLLSVISFTSAKGKLVKFWKVE